MQDSQYDVIGSLIIHDLNLTQIHPERTPEEMVKSFFTQKQTR